MPERPLLAALGHQMQNMHQQQQMAAAGQCAMPTQMPFNLQMPPTCIESRNQAVAMQMMNAFPTATPEDYAAVMATQPSTAQDAVTQLLHIMQQRASQHSPAQALHNQACHYVDFNDFHKTYGQKPYSPGQGPAPQLPAGMAAGGQVPPSGRKKALLISCNYDGTKNELRGCREDSRRMHELLTKVYGYVDSPNRFLMLNDAPENKQHGRQQYLPTKQNVLTAMRWLVEGASPGDVLFLHYSGHGGQAKASDGTQFEQDGMNETIYPMDFDRAGCILDNEMSDIMVSRLHEGIKLIVLLDCCHSGGALDLPHYYQPDKASHWMDERVSNMPVADAILISGCKSNQTSADVNFEKQNQDVTGGAMTLAFLATVYPNPFNLSHEKMMHDMNACMKQRGFKQVSVLSSAQAFPLQRPFKMDEIITNTNRL